jgi:hypothetical protein
MTYPQDFPADSRAKVEASRIRAGRKFDSACERLDSALELEKAFWRCVLTPFLAFAEEACRLRLWPVDEMDEKCREALRQLTIHAYYDKGRGIVRDPIGYFDGSLLVEAEQELKRTSQWRKYENLCLKLASAHSSHPQNRNKTAKSAQSKPADTRPFTHSADYRSVAVQGKAYTLTTHQAAMVQILHENYENGSPDVSIVYIMDRRGTPNSRWQDTWKSNSKAKQALIKEGARRGTLRLNL